jgi:hypothetical protein
MPMTKATIEGVLKVTDPDPEEEPLAAWERELMESHGGSYAHYEEIGRVKHEPFTTSPLADVLSESPVQHIEDEAGKLVRRGARQETYGHPRGDFDRVAGMWSALLGVKIDAEKVAVMMIAFKLARLSQTPQHRDSKVDVIGYTICLDRLDEPWVTDEDYYVVSEAA